MDVVMSVLLCHVVWMPRYAGEEEVRAAGFDYVQKEGFGHELFNFLPVEGICYGFVQTRTGVIKIARLGAEKTDTFVDGVSVIWTATHPNGGRAVVGWYNNARVYRDSQQGRVSSRFVSGKRIGFITSASAKDCFLVPEDNRKFQVPRGKTGLPGQSPVFFPNDSTNKQMVSWLEEVREYISDWSGTPVATDDGSSLPSQDGAPSTKRGMGWSTQPDAAHNAAVEAAAIKCVREHFGIPFKDCQKDNCGWDLEFAVDGSKLCVEVKGMSGADIGVELTPNEFTAMERAMNGGFHEGGYRLAVVCNALDNPKLSIFVHEQGMVWHCEKSQRRIKATTRVAARLA